VAPPIFSHLRDRCNCPAEGTETRYIAKIQVYAAPSEIHISAEELVAPPTQELAKIDDDCAGMTEEELMRDVHVEFSYDLCRTCQKEYIKSPIPPVEP
jgi:hypothetical protein